MHAVPAADRAFAVMPGMLNTHWNNWHTGSLGQQGGAQTSLQEVARITVNRPFRKNADRAARRQNVVCAVQRVAFRNIKSL